LIGHLFRSKRGVSIYIGGWLKKLQNDSRLVVQAAAAAQKAANYILGVKHSDEEEADRS